MKTWMVAEIKDTISFAAFLVQSQNQQIVKIKTLNIFSHQPGLQEEIRIWLKNWFEIWYAHKSYGIDVHNVSIGIAMVVAMQSVYNND